MEIYELIETLEERLERAMQIPLVGRALVDRDELLKILEDFRLKLPDNIKKAKWVSEERERIMEEARLEAAGLIKSAEDKVAMMLNEHEITRKAYAQANAVVENAKQHSRDIRLGAINYAENTFTELEKKLSVYINDVRLNNEDLRKMK